MWEYNLFFISPPMLNDWVVLCWVLFVTCKISTMEVVQSKNTSLKHFIKITSDQQHLLLSFQIAEKRSQVVVSWQGFLFFPRPIGLHVTDLKQQMGNFNGITFWKTRVMKCTKLCMAITKTQKLRKMIVHAVNCEYTCCLVVLVCMQQCQWKAPPRIRQFYVVGKSVVAADKRFQGPEWI